MNYYDYIAYCWCKFKKYNHNLHILLLFESTETIEKLDNNIRYI